MAAAILKFKYQTSNVMMHTRQKNEFKKFSEFIMQKQRVQYDDSTQHLRLRNVLLHNWASVKKF